MAEFRDSSEPELLASGHPAFSPQINGHRCTQSDSNISPHFPSPTKNRIHGQHANGSLDNVALPHYSSLSIESPAPSPMPSPDLSSSPIGESALEYPVHHAPASPFIEHRQVKLAFSKVPIEDVMALRSFLAQVDLRRYGFGLYGEDTQEAGEFCSQYAKYNSHSSDRGSHHYPPHPSMAYSSSSSHLSLLSQRDDYFDHFEDDHGGYQPPRLVAMTRHKAPLNSSLPTSSSSFDIPLSSSPSKPKTSKRISSSPLSSSSSSSSGGYKGKHGLNPVCASCHTTKTPYWRDAWHLGILLCNACGLRFAKFKRRCTQCHYVPRKDDKGGRHCPLCKGPWTQ